MPVVLVTCAVLTANIALTAPAGTVMLEGTVATDESLVPSCTITPPARAGFCSVAVPVADDPPATVAGLTESDCSGLRAVGGVTVTAMLADDEPYEAVAVTAVAVGTVVVV
jgi:hypothetical protein